VLYNGKPRWQAATQIADLIEPAPGTLAEYTPQLKYLLLDEGALDESGPRALNNLVADVTIIRRCDAEGDAVVMSLDHYNSIMETLHLTSHPANAAALARAIAQDQTGPAQEHPLLPAD
jgi:antitoxin YefM